MEHSEHPHLLHTRLTHLWGIDVPIVGAPMAGRADAELAAAVSNAGGLGMFGVGAKTSGEWITQQAQRTRELAPGKPFGLGLMLWALQDQPEQWDAALQAHPDVISLGFGDPLPYVEQAHQEGISVVAPVNDVTQLKQALAADVDAICIQGTDAGGHTGHIGTMPLMQMVLDFLTTQAPGVPAAVAGGISSGRGVASALAAGADAAWIGTALLASPEAIGSAALREAAVAAHARDMVLTDVYDRAEQVAWDTEKWPTRTLNNGFVQAFSGGDATDRELIAARQPGGDFADDVKLHAGQGIGMLVAERPAGEVVRALTEQAERLLGRYRAH